MNYKTIILVTMLSFLINPVFGNDCLMKCQSFEELLDLIEKDFSKDSTEIARYRWQIKKPKYRLAVDTLFAFAKKHFSERLSENLLCERVSISANHSFANMFRDRTQINFTFNFDKEPLIRRNDHADYSFTFNTKTNKISYRIGPSNVWIPDCKNSPDSCNFKITKREQAIDTLVKKGIIKDKYSILGHSKNFLPFHFNLPVKTEDDCMMKDYSIDMYTGKITISDVYQRDWCLTVTDMVKNADLVIQGEIRTATKCENYEGENDFRKGAMIEGRISSTVEIEVQKIFKGEVLSPVIEAIIEGGRVGKYTASVSHGSINPGAPGSPYIFFLKKEGAYWLDNLKKLDSLTLFPMYGFTSDAIPVYEPGYKSYAREIEKKLYHKIEEVTGRERIDIRYPENTIKELIDWRVDNQMTVPDRNSGLAFYKYAKAVDEENYLPFHIYVGGSNRPSYLKSWTLRVSYNSKAFGRNLISKEKLKYELVNNTSNTAHWLGDKRISEDYFFKIKEDSDQSFLIKFEKIGNDYPFFQIVPARLFLLDLKFPIISEEENTNIKIEVVGEPIALDLKTGKTQKYDYVYCPPILKDTPKSLRKPKVLDFYPKVVSIGDTVIIDGNFLKDATVKLYGQSPRGRSFYGFIPKRKIVENNETKIRFIVPESLNEDDSYFGKGSYHKPISGGIFLKKECSGSGISTTEKLEILEK